MGLNVPRRPYEQRIIDAKRAVYKGKQENADQPANGEEQ
jgi:hypothetical protein